MKKEYITPEFDIKRVIIEDVLGASTFTPEPTIQEETENGDW